MSRQTRASIRPAISYRDSIDWLCGVDKDLNRVVVDFGYPPTWYRQPGFATLVRIILEQQVSQGSAKQAYRRLQQAAGRITPTQVQKLGIAGIRNAGITRQKSRYCLSLAEKILSREILIRGTIDPSELRARLLELPGIGFWTADVYLMMAERAPDIWPQGDLVLAKELQRIKRLPGLPDHQRQMQIASQWSPCRSHAARILWHNYLSRR